MRDAGGGITNSQHATLSDGVVMHDAHVQTIDQSRFVFKPSTGPQEFNFKDSYRCNVAVYRLALPARSRQCAGVGGTLGQR